MPSRSQGAAEKWLKCSGRLEDLYLGNSSRQFAAVPDIGIFNLAKVKMNGIVTVQGCPNGCQESSAGLEILKKVLILYGRYGRMNFVK